MAEVINTNVFDETLHKFIDVKGLDYFWDKAKAYIDAEDNAIKGRLSTAETKITTAEGKITTLETTVGDSSKGLVKDVAELRKDLNDVTGGNGSIANQIKNAIDALDLPNTYDEKGAAAKALTDAKAYADGLAGNYDASGAAAQALTDAKAYTDAREIVINKKIEDDVKVVADDLKEHVENGTIHITAQERTDWNAAKSRIDTFLKDADLTENAVDTLKELQAYMTSDGAAAEQLVNRVAALEAADTTIRGEFAAADATTLASAKSYADGLKAEIDGVIEENEKTTAEALTDLEGRVDTLEASKDAYVAADAQVLADAKEYADEKDATTLAAAKADAKSQADAALASAKTYADDAASTAAGQALADAKDHVTTVIANYYTKTQVDESLALKADKATTYTKTEVDNLLSTNSTGDRSYAKQYTDELFASVKFAQNSDIDGIF